ncbi:MAG: hypothetical protein MJZ28_08665 [Paludibacteraceae bacterium]|nr:hypothetical protein [Paludibacteraceae bacterium]
MRHLSIYATALISALALCACEKDGTEVENPEITDRIQPIPTTDYKAIGKARGESFASGVLEVKDVVTDAYNAAQRGFPYDSLTFCKNMTPALASCQFSFKKYMEASENDSIFSSWNEGFSQGFREKTGKDDLTMNSLLNTYREIDMDSVANKSNIKKVIEMALRLGGQQPKITDQKVL